MGRAMQFVTLASVVTLGAIGMLAAVEGSDSASLQKPRPLCLGKRATIVGNGKANVLTGTRRNDVIVGLGGNDTIEGRAGKDLLCGGAASDRLFGGAGSDRLDGGGGRDTCRGGERLVRCEETRADVRPGPLAPGAYVTDVFRPRFGFVAGSGWSVQFYGPTQVLLSQRRDPGGLGLTFDSFAGRQSVAAVIARYAGISGVEAETPTAAAIGGRNGQRVDLLVTGSEIVLVPGLEDRYELEPNDRLRAYAIDVGGVTVSILVEAPAPEFAAFFAEVEGLLASVTWG